MPCDHVIIYDVTSRYDTRARSVCLNCDARFSGPAVTGEWRPTGAREWTPDASADVPAGPLESAEEVNHV